MFAWRTPLHPSNLSSRISSLAKCFPVPSEDLSSPRPALSPSTSPAQLSSWHLFWSEAISLTHVSYLMAAFLVSMWAPWAGTSPVVFTVITPVPRKVPGTELTLRNLLLNERVMLGWIRGSPRLYARWKFQGCCKLHTAKYKSGEGKTIPKYWGIGKDSDIPTSWQALCSLKPPADCFSSVLLFTRSEKADGQWGGDGSLS